MANSKTSKKKKLNGTNLRVLSIAYATGRITRDAYLKERTRQLGALEFGKPLPSLPEELYDINIPTVKIDASHVNARKRRRSLNKVIFIILLLILISAAGGLWYTGIFTPEPQPAQTKQLTLSDHANHLLQNQDWSERDIMAFLRIWATHSASAREKARSTSWYLKLDNEIIKRINQTRLRQESGDELLPGEKRQLDLLRAFQAQLSSN